MKRILILLSILCALTTASKAQYPDEDPLYVRVEQPAEFPGGTEAMTLFLGENVKYPVVALENKIEGKAICQFIVNKDGSITDVEVVRSSGDASLDKEAVRVINAMPNWTPAMQRGKIVRMRFMLPVVFRLPEERPMPTQQ